MALCGASGHAQLTAGQPLLANFVKIGAADRSLEWLSNLVIQAGNIYCRLLGRGCDGLRELGISLGHSKRGIDRVQNIWARNTEFLALSFEVIDLFRLFQSVKLDKLPIA